MVEYQTPKGMRDFSGSAMLARQAMVRRIEDVYKSWGYQPLSTPALESISTLTAKSGAEIAGQLFRIEESALALRFDLTVPLARFAANSTMPKPYKRYCIAPVWRREEPQKGRMREFLQADADIVGCPSMRAEAELLAMASNALEALGFQDFTIHLNNRKILSGLVSGLGAKERETEVFRALDKLDKIGPDALRMELEKAGLGADEADELMRVISSGGGDNAKSLASAERYSAEGAAELGEILALLQKDYSLSNVVIDLSLVRGLGYYTGPIFEIKAGGGIGSVSGGGRYDDLLGVYGQADCAVGISLGIERLWYLQEQKLKAGPATPAKLMLVAVKPDFITPTTALALRLRAAGLALETDLLGRPMRKQLDYANALGIPFALIIGEQELKAGRYTLKDMASGEQKTLSEEELVARFAKKE